MKSIGIEIRNDSWAVVGLKRTVYGVRTKGYRFLTGETVKDRLGELKSFIAEAGLGGADVTIGLPKEDVIIKAVQIPAPSVDAIGEILRYEIAKHIPFFVDDVYYDYQILGWKDGLFVVLFASVKKAYVDEIFEQFKMVNNSGLFCVDTYSTALFNSIYFCEKASHEDNVSVVNIRKKDVSVDTFAGCAPADSRRIEIDETHWRHWIGSLVRELKFTEAVLKSHPWMRTLDRVVVISEMPIEEGFLSALKDSTELQVTVPASSRTQLPLNAMPALGLALAALGKAKLDIDILPAVSSWKKRVGSYSHIALVGMVAVLLGMVFISYLIRERLTLNRLESALSEINGETDGLRKHTAELKLIDERIRTIERIEGRTFPNALDVLKELAVLLPYGTYLTGFEYKSGIIYIDGFSDQASSLLFLIEKSKFMKDLEFVGQITKTSDRKDRFRIKASIEDSHNL